MKFIKRYTLVFILFVVLSALTTTDANWQELTSKDGFKIFQKTVVDDFNGEKTSYRVFKYVNNNKFDINASWRLDLFYNGLCRSCDLPSPNEYELKLFLKANSTISYTGNEVGNIYKVIDKIESNKNSKLEKVVITNLIVNK